MDYLKDISAVERFKRLERKTILLAYLIFGVYFNFAHPKNKYAKLLFLTADTLVMFDTLSDLIKEFRYKCRHRKNRRRSRED